LDEMQADAPDALDVAADHAPISAKFLTETNRHRVLELRAAHLDDRGELLLLQLEGFVPAPQLRHQLPAEVERGDMHTRWESVIGGLGHVDVTVRANDLVIALGVIEELEGAVGDHLISVHIDGRSGAALNRIDDELVV